MVCVPCIIVPVLLWIFYKFINPWLSKLWGNSENYVLSNLTCPAPERKKKVTPDENGQSKSKGEEEGEQKEQNGEAHHSNLGERLKAE